MKGNIRDEIPIGHAQVWPAIQQSKPSLRQRRVDWQDELISDAEALRRAGLSPTAIKQFRKRHPELVGWSRTRMIEQMLENKKRRANASRRKQEAKH